MINAGAQMLTPGSSNWIWRISTKKMLKTLTLQRVRNWSRSGVSPFTGRKSLGMF